MWNLRREVFHVRNRGVMRFLSVLPPRVFFKVSSVRPAKPYLEDEDIAKALRFYPSRCAA